MRQGSLARSLCMCVCMCVSYMFVCLLYYYNGSAVLFDNRIELNVYTRYHMMIARDGPEIFAYYILVPHRIRIPTLHTRNRCWIVLCAAPSRSTNGKKYGKKEQNKYLDWFRIRDGITYEKGKNLSGQKKRIVDERGDMFIKCQGTYQ